MADTLVHRGPDASGVTASGPVVLGHRRLSIIDRSAANDQPLASGDGSCLIVFNGEIYNFRALRAELEKRGSAFRTRGDTEVILEAWRHWGTGCVERLHGMFAFALWDAKREQFFLARDRLGEKPLFYTLLPGGSLLFASEMRALLAHPDLPRKVDEAGLGNFLSLNYTLGEHTLLDGVTRLPPAHTLLLERGRAPAIRCYWDLAVHFRAKDRFGSLEEAAREVSRLLDEAVEERLVADVPLGAFLSGGVDSSSLVASMAQLGDPRQVKTFSIGFEEPGFDEVEEARSVADVIGVDHRDRTQRPAVELMEHVLAAAAEEPLADTSFLPTWALARFARESVTVALSGDGGDECFAGYETYVADRLQRRLRPVPARLRRAAARAANAVLPVTFGKVSFDYKARQFLAAAGMDERRAHWHWRNIFGAEDLARLLRPEWREVVLEADAFDRFDRHFDAVADCHWLDRCSYVDLKTWLPDDILVKVDRATMAHSLESRAPFLDHRLVEAAAALPPSWKLHGRSKKHVLKLSQVGRLPDSVLNRPKRGFNAPISHWFHGALLPMARRVLADERLGTWFERPAVEALLDDHIALRRDNGLRILSLTCFALWLRHVFGE
jgi:asparagine synthase (glutamine-hydrolysing)